MPQKSDTMSIPDATMTLLLLAEWSPPEGLTVTISSSCNPDTPHTRVVNVVLSAVDDQFCVINVGGVPNAVALDALTQAGRLLLEAAWDQQSCLSLGMAPDGGQISASVHADVMAPGGLLNLRSTPHALFDTTQFGRDD